MSGTIQFMIPGEIFPTFFRFHLYKISVQVPVFLLCRYNQINPLIVFFFQFFIGLQSQAICHSLKHFCHIGIPENVWFLGHTLFPVQPESVQSAGFDGLCHSCRYGAFNTGFDPSGKNFVIQLNISDSRSVVFSHVVYLLWKLPVFFYYAANCVETDFLRVLFFGEAEIPAGFQTI